MSVNKVPRRSASTSSLEERIVKRRKIELPPLTAEDYKNGVVLAPMVRSGTMVTRLFALKYGANLVWGPEIVDKAILHSERRVDPATGVISYVGQSQSKAMFTTHPVEKPYLIYQIGTADPELAVQAAKTVMQDVAGIDLNCGCPKPFSTHAGMGAALLSNPDLLCSILVALRAAMPPEIAVSAKIRLLPSQEDTLNLVERIVNTGITNLTVHCRTRNMRPRERALIGRMREIVEFVEGMGKGISIIQNGDCLSFEDSKRIRKITGAHSTMIATAAEANPTCFSPTPLTDLETTFVPSYIRVAKYLDAHWAVTKFCSAAFKGSHADGSKAEASAIRKRIVSAKTYEDLDELVGPWTGEKEFQEILEAIEMRDGRRPVFAENALSLSAETSLLENAHEQETSEAIKTPIHNLSPDPAILRAPLGPANTARMYIPALISGHDEPTPTPTPAEMHSPAPALAV
ncbi:FMN-linked oxidoreductase [Trametopsis cervina]|nr:FMN-linked oxidoreductase [Trametopsis cervina]